MKFKMSLLFVCTLAMLISNAQSGEKKENFRLAKLNAHGTYPAIKASKLSGVLPVEGINEKPDSTQKYKLVISFTLGTSDAVKAKELNHGLAEIGRIINLHLAAGIRKENLEVVIVAHSKALFSLLNNDAFKKEFKVDNPNLQIIKEIEATGGRFVACGQAMGFLEIKNEELLPEVKIALAAKVALSTYQQKGYALFEIDEED